MKMLSAAVAAVILLLVSLAWLRGGWRSEGMASVTAAGTFNTVAHYRGSLLVVVTDAAAGEPRSARVRCFSVPAEHLDGFVRAVLRSDAKLNLLGLRCYSRHGGGHVLLIVPPWVFCGVASLLLLAPALKRRHPPEHCRTCGYDLRASAGRCPECGMAIENSLAAPGGAR